MLGLVVGHMSQNASRVVTKVERRAMYSIDDDESCRQGGAGSLCWILFDERAQESGAVRRRLGVDGIRVCQR